MTYEHLGGRTPWLTKTAKPHWAIRKRLEFIEFRLFWEGRLNRENIEEYFDISKSQATKDIDDYKEYTKRKSVDIGKIAENTRYDKSKKCYVRVDPFVPRFITIDPQQYLMNLAASETREQVVCDFGSDSELIDIYAPPLLDRRPIISEVLRSLVQAIRHGNDLEACYESPNTPGRIYVRVTPRAFGHDGFRWHCRAFRHDKKRFRDLVLDRIFEVTKTTKTDETEIPVDRAWEDTFVIVLQPNPGLDEHGKRHIEQQYGMLDGELRVAIRKCFVVYFLKRYQLEEEITNKRPHQQPIVIKNRDAVTAIIPPHMRIPPEN